MDSPSGAASRPAPTAANIRARVRGLRKPTGGAWAGLDVKNMPRAKLAAIVIGAFALTALLVSTVGEAYLPIAAAVSGVSSRLGSSSVRGVPDWAALGDGRESVRNIRADCPARCTEPASTSASSSLCLGPSRVDRQCCHRAEQALRSASTQLQSDAQLRRHPFGATQETSTLATLGPLGHPKPRGGRAPPGISEALAEQGLRSLTPDVSDALPASFDPSFKSPCWLGNASEPGGPPRRHCLPFYFLLGNWQSGVRDLQSRLEHHPDVVKGANAAPHFWDERHPFDQYQRIFDQCGGPAAHPPASPRPQQRARRSPRRLLSVTPLRWSLVSWALRPPALTFRPLQPADSLRWLASWPQLSPNRSAPRSAVPFVEAAPERATVGDSSPSYFAFTWTASEARAAPRPPSSQNSRCMCGRCPLIHLIPAPARPRRQRLHDPWIKAVLKCRDDCQQKQPCIQDRCYKEASEAYPPLSGAPVLSHRLLQSVTPLSPSLPLETHRQIEPPAEPRAATRAVFCRRRREAHPPLLPPPSHRCGFLPAAATASALTPSARAHAAHPSPRALGAQLSPLRPPPGALRRQERPPRDHAP